MKKPVLLTLALAGLAAAQPVIVSIENAASNLPAGLPNSAIAQGAMLVVKGSGLGPANVVVDGTFPLATSLAETSVRVVVGGQTRDAIMYYTLDRQVAAILPSSTPVGTGTLTVTYNGQTSAQAPITVVASNVAIYTLDSTGAGAAVATFQIPPAGGPFLSPINSAVAGDSVILWGNGLGGVTSDETNPAVQSDLTSVPVEAYVGGQPATILFRGRNGCCSSVDTIFLRIPPGVSGCVVPVVLKIGNLVSNTATIPIAATGRTCSTTLPGFSSQEFQTLLSRPNINFGIVTLIRSSISTAEGGLLLADTGNASFARYAGPSVFRLLNTFDTPAFGTCKVHTLAGIPGGAVTGYSGAVPYQPLDGGPAINLVGPAGSRTLSRQPSGDGYTALLGGTTPGNYLDPGSYTASAAGGVDIGQFSATFPFLSAVEWSNQREITNVNRSAGVTVRWTGGDPNGYTIISGVSYFYPSITLGVGSVFTCTERTSVGSLTVPPVVLLSLPTGASFLGTPVPGSITVSSFSPVTRFQAPNLDLGVALSNIVITKPVFFQ